jgi:hypothetical protein
VNLFHKSTATILLLLPISMATLAAEPQKSPEPMKSMGMHHGMMGNMTEEEREQQLKSMQEHMLIMHDLSNQILAEKDPAKKEQLKKQQLELMKTHHSQMMQHHPK